MPSFIRNRIEVVSSASIAAAALETLGEDVVDRPAQIDHGVDGVHAHGHQAPKGVSALSARQWPGLMNSTLGNVMVASTCRMVPSSPERIMSRSLIVSGCRRRL